MIARRVAAATLLFLTAARVASGQVPDTARALLDVPYYAQAPLQCGAAALAMVLRYWGHPTAVPADFVDLVDETAGGISTADITVSAGREGWQAHALRAPAGEPLDVLASHVARGRPVIALIDDEAPVLHYVVVVGLTDDHVLIHDPASAPYTGITTAEFEARWQRTSNWMLVILPPGDGAGGDVATASIAAAAPGADRPAASRWDGCSAIVTRGVELAASDRSAAETALLDAVSRCPDEAAGYRELSGLRLLERRWPESVAMAEAALAREPDDAHAIDLLAAGRFALGDRLGALQAWSLRGGLTIDSLDVAGLRRTRQPIVNGLVGVEPGERLTDARMIRLGRRLEELSTATRHDARYTTVGADRAALELTAAERRLLPTDLVGLAGVATEAALTRTIRVNVAAPFRRGDLWQPSFRWPGEWRRLGLDVDLPLGQQGPGILRVEMFGEHQTYRPVADGATFVEDRRRVAASWADWVASPVRVEVGGGSDRFDGERHLSLFAGTIVRVAGDRLAARVRAERWTGNDVRDGFTTLDTSVDWRSNTRTDVPVWTARAGWSLASSAAPLALWPGAGSQLDRTTLLRAHRLVVSDVVTGGVLGRRLAYLSVERHDPIVSTSLGRLALATFVDAAQARQRLTLPGPSEVHVDVGAGLRAAQAGDDNVIRLDLAVGLRDGRVRVSAGYVARWGRP